MASSKKNYDVFLSFRGTDVRNNFLSHLYDALVRNGIHTFKDSEELWKGEQISPALIRAIEESRVAIVIFSEDYASSQWCLKELAKIMECKDLIVLPVFYKVEPREVRGLREGYGRAMATHESDLGKDSETVDRWKKALVGAGKLAGWDYNNEDEAKFIRGIVEQVSSYLVRTTAPYVAKYPVGIDSRVREMISLSQKESDGDDVLMIGIWGPGGIGKTTIARAIYNAIKRQFQGSCFLERVRETSDKSDGLVDLQRRLLSQILSSGHLLVPNVHDGISLIRDRLCYKKVLLVLDDVDHLDQLNALAERSHWFGKGSRIFVTSRDKHLFTLSRCKNRLYEVKPLDHDEALDLFNQHAFSNCKKHEIRKDLIGRALHYAGGFPLALGVLGSFLCGREEPAWESALHNLSKCPDQTINKVLKISFEGLENNEKEVFLDIACFFKGKSIEYIKKVIDCCDFHATIGIQVLIEKSLIRNEEGTLEMHDLVRLMGENIVKQECLHDPRKRSRLWIFEDVLDILCECDDTGMNAVQAIVLDLPTPEEITSLEEIIIKADAIRSMKMLRMLILPEVHISSEGPIRLPNNLKWFEWPNFPLLEFGSKLVGIDVRKSRISNLEGKFKHCRKLKHINFSQCKYLISIPDLSSLPNLESLILNGCKSLVEVHQSVGYLDKLQFLSLQFCSNLSIFPHTLKAKSLQALDLSGCCKLEKFSDIPEKMERLEELDLGWTAIKELPASVENLPSVKLIHLRKCKRLTMLPSSVYKLQNLEYLSLESCSNFAVFPKNSTDPNGNPGFRNLYRLELWGCNLSEVEFLESSSSFPKLAHLNLSHNKFTHLPTCINKYDNLEHLIVEKCKQLQKIPQLPPNVHMLEASRCRSLQEFPDLSGLSSNRLRVEFRSCRELFRKGANTTDALSLKELPKMKYADILLTGREMPEWFLQCKDGSISFMVPRDLYDKFLGLALCLVHGPEEGNPLFGIHISVNGRMVFGLGRGFRSLKSDHVWILYLPRSELYQECKESELQQDDRNHFQVCFYKSEGRLKKYGFRLICEQQEDDLRIELQHHQPMETNLSLEERDSEEDNWIDTEEEESSRETDDELIKAMDPVREKDEIYYADKMYSPEGEDGCWARRSGCRCRQRSWKLVLWKREKIIRRF